MTNRPIHFSTETAIPEFCYELPPERYSLLQRESDLATSISCEGIDRFLKRGDKIWVGHILGKSTDERTGRERPIHATYLEFLKSKRPEKQKTEEMPTEQDAKKTFTFVKKYAGDDPWLTYEEIADGIVKDTNERMVQAGSDVRLTPDNPSVNWLVGNRAWEIRSSAAMHVFAENPEIKKGTTEIDPTVKFWHTVGWGGLYATLIALASWLLVRNVTWGLRGLGYGISFFCSQVRCGMVPGISSGLLHRGLSRFSVSRFGWWLFRKPKTPWMWQGSKQAFKYIGKRTAATFAVGAAVWGLAMLYNRIQSGGDENKSHLKKLSKKIPVFGIFF